MEHLSPAVASLLEAVVRQPTHFTPLRTGHLESVAALFQVHPFVVSELREQLRRPSVRRTVAAPLYRAWRGRKALDAGPCWKRRAAPTVAALLQAVEATPGGTELFTHSPVETVATLFRVHPFVVEAAREVSSQHQAGDDAAAPSPSWLPPGRA